MNDMSEEELFRAVLEAGALPIYDPAIHLLPATAAAQWGVDVKTAITRLREVAPKRGLVEIRVRNANNRPAIAFAKQQPGLS